MSAIDWGLGPTAIVVEPTAIPAAAPMRSLRRQPILIEQVAALVLELVPMLVAIGLAAILWAAGKAVN